MPSKQGPETGTVPGALFEQRKLLSYEDDEDFDGAPCNDDCETANAKTRFLGRPRQALSTLSGMRGLVLFSLTIVSTLALGGALGYYIRPGCTERECVYMTSSYSPLLDQVEYYDYQFEAELGARNVYKGHPRPELDEEWERIGRIHPISMEDKYRGVLNKTNSGIHYAEAQGGGIMVEIEVFHQLHCLDFLRKVIYADYYSRPEYRPITFQVSDEMLFNHVDHCIDYLRQVMMCESDVTPVTSNWVQNHHSPHPDFNTMHRCRNFTKLLEWVEEHDNGGVPKQSPNPSWWPSPSLANTILDYEPNFPVPPHGPPANDSNRWTHNPRPGQSEEVLPGHA